MTDNIVRTVSPVTHQLGGFSVRRILPSRQKAMCGPFIFVDEFGPAQLDVGGDMGVRPHPHIGLATVTYLFEGAIDHRDSLGTYQTIRPGEVNLMTAGRGIVHSERSPAEEKAKGPRLFGMQTWLALPDALEDSDPAFQNVAAADLPMVEDGKARARVIMGSLWGAAAPTTCHSPTIYADIVLQAGGSIRIDADADERGVMIADGAGTLDGTVLEPYTLYFLKPGAAMTLASDQGCRAMLLGGQDFVAPRHIWWNFVASTNERIKQAQEDWNAGNFPKVPGDEEEFIPIPDVPLTRGRN